MGQKGSEKEAAQFGDDASDTVILFDSQVVWDVWVMDGVNVPIPSQTWRCSRPFHWISWVMVTHGFQLPLARCGLLMQTRQVSGSLFCVPSVPSLKVNGSFLDWQHLILCRLAKVVASCCYFGAPELTQK